MVYLFCFRLPITVHSISVFKQKALLKIIFCFDYVLNFLCEFVCVSLFVLSFYSKQSKTKNFVSCKIIVDLHEVLSNIPPLSMASNCISVSPAYVMLD